MDCRRYLSRLLLSALALGSARAQAGAEHWFDDVPVVLSASRLSQSRFEAPLPISTIDREMIRASGVLDVADLFRLIPGMLVGHYNGHRPVVTYLGLSDEFPRRVQVLIDGRSAYTPSLGGVPWARLPLALEDIERIEIIRGPNTVTHGSNAFLAVINIITRHAGEDHGLAARMSLGNDGIRRGYLRYAGSHDDVDYRLSITAAADDGFPKLPDRWHAATVGGRVDWQATSEDALEYSFGFGDGEFRDGDPDSPVDTVRDIPASVAFQHLRWLHTGTDGAETALRFAWTRDDYDDQAFGSLFGFPTELDFRIHSQRYVTELQHTAQASPALRYVTGASVEYETVEAPGLRNRDSDGRIWIYRVFGNLEWRLAEQWLLHLGGMFEYDTIAGGKVSPRLALNWLPDETQSVRLGVSRAVRTPHIIEETIDFGLAIGPGRDIIQTTSGDLDPEHIVMLELGWIKRIPEIGLTVDARVYQTSVRDIIAPMNAEVFNPVFGETDDFDEFHNIGHLKIRGLEAEFDWDMPRRRIRGGVSSLYVVDTSPVDDPHDSVPTRSAVLQWIERLNATTTASAAFELHGPVEFQGSGNPLPGVKKLNLSLGHEMPALDGELELRLSGELQLADNRDFRRQNDPGSQFWATIGWRPRH
ncbi:MAG: TonB-dependent receptor [Chromatiales bacterium]|nr:TonB-dependent receptor [Chromatiales bacterium]